jgi:hypothetical protein
MSGAVDAELLERRLLRARRCEPDPWQLSPDDEPSRADVAHVGRP